MKQLKCKYGYHLEYTGIVLDFIVVDRNVRAVVCSTDTGCVTIQPLHIITILAL